MSGRLDHVVVAVTDPVRSDRFYRDVVGAEVVGMTAGSSIASASNS